MVPLLQWLVLVVAILLLYKLVNYFGDPELMQWVQDMWAGDTESWWDRPPSSKPDVTLCSLCHHKQGHLRCSICRSATYCSIDCQRKHWREFGHKSECADLAMERKAAEGPQAHGIRPPRESIFPYKGFLALAQDDSLARRQPLGLENCGNSCYANAVLQCLLATPPLAAYLHSGRHKKGCIAPAGSWCALCALEDLATEMFDPDQSLASAKGFMQHIKKLGKDFAIGRQEDSHEFLVQLLDAIETITLRERGSWADLDARSRETTLVHHIFGSYLRSECVCSVCNHASRSYECAITLEVQVPDEGHNLEAALERFSAVDILDGDNMYNCERCECLVRAYRSTRIDVAPNVLQICLKRYRHMPGRFQSKNNAKVAYGEKLDLAPYMAVIPLDSGPVTYSLLGVVVHVDHMNSTTFGHYVSYVCKGGDRWFDCDDTQVTQVTKNTVLERNAYMLFYTRDKARPSLASLCEAYGRVHEAAAAANREAAAAEKPPSVSTEGEAGALPMPPMLHRIMTSPAALQHMVQDDPTARFYQSAQYGSFLQLAPEGSPIRLPGTFHRRHSSGGSSASSSTASSGNASPTQSAASPAFGNAFPAYGNASPASTLPRAATPPLPSASPPAAPLTPPPAAYGNGNDAGARPSDVGPAAPAQPYVTAMQGVGEGRQPQGNAGGPSGGANHVSGYGDDISRGVKTPPGVARAPRGVTDCDARPSSGPDGYPPTAGEAYAGPSNGVLTPEQAWRMNHGTANGTPVLPADTDRQNSMPGSLIAGGVGIREVSGSSAGVSYQELPFPGRVDNGIAAEAGVEASVLPLWQNGNTAGVGTDVDMVQVRTGGVKRDRPEPQEKGSAGLQKGFLLHQRRVKSTGVGFEQDI